MGKYLFKPAGVIVATGVEIGVDEGVDVALVLVAVAGGFNTAAEVAWGLDTAAAAAAAAAAAEGADDTSVRSARASSCNSRLPCSSFSAASTSAHNGVKDITLVFVQAQLFSSHPQSASA